MNITISVGALAELVEALQALEGVVGIAVSETPDWLYLFIQYQWVNELHLHPARRGNNVPALTRLTINATLNRFGGFQYGYETPGVGGFLSSAWRKEGGAK